MAVSVVTFRKGGTREAMIAATRKLKAVWDKHGAESIVLSQVTVGPDTGHSAIRITFNNWDAFGKAMQSASNDPAMGESVAGLDAVSEMVCRRLMATVDL